MAANGIAFVRIDDRLVHGQVVQAWNAIVKANVMVVVSNSVATNETTQELMRSAAPQSVSVEFCSVADAPHVLEELASRKRVFVLVERPLDASALVQAGVGITCVNVGNMHSGEGRRDVAPSVAVSAEDEQAFRQLRDAGVALEIRRVPTSPQVAVEPLFG